MDGATNNRSGPSATNIASGCQTSPAPIETASRLLFSSDYYRKVDRTTDIAGRLPNAVFTLPPRLVQAIVGRAELSAATREALVAECKKLYLASREYEENKVVFVDMYCARSTTITLDCGRLYSEGDNEHGQCGIGSEEKKVTGPRLIRLPPVLQVWCGHHRWFAKTTRGLYTWGRSYLGRLGVGGGVPVNRPRLVPIDGNVQDISLNAAASFIRTGSGWLACGENSNGQCGVGSTDRWVTTLTPVALPDDVNTGVDRVMCSPNITFFIAGRRCFSCGVNRVGQLGIGSDEHSICTPTELPVPVDDIMFRYDVTIIRSGDALLACGVNMSRLVSATDAHKIVTPIPLDLPGPVVKLVLDWGNLFVRLGGAGWVGRGVNDDVIFIPVPEADLINDRVLPGWTPVTDQFANSLDEEADHAIILRPIGDQCPAWYQPW